MESEIMKTKISLILLCLLVLLTFSVFSITTDLSETNVFEKNTMDSETKVTIEIADEVKEAVDLQESAKKNEIFKVDINELIELKEQIKGLFDILQLEVVEPDFQAENEPIYANIPETIIYENDKIWFRCRDCYEHERPILEESFRLQTMAYDCLEDYFDWAPREIGVKISYELEHLEYPKGSEEFEQMYGPQVSRYLPGGPDSSRIVSIGFIGELNEGETAVSSIENVRMDIHETTHAFTHAALNDARFGESCVPIWYDEAMSILTEGEGVLDCGSDKRYIDTRYNMKDHYQRLKEEGIAPYNLFSSHIKGGLFIAGLELDYDCDLHCVAEIWNILRIDYEGRNARTIKHAAERVTGYDLTSLFEMLEIWYTVDNYQNSECDPWSGEGCY